MNTLYTILYMVIYKFDFCVACIYPIITFLLFFFHFFVGQVDTLPVRSTKATEACANRAFNALSKDGEYELVRGSSASESTELAFSNSLYAEPEREVTCEIYESVSSFFLTQVLMLFWYTAIFMS